MAILTALKISHPERKLPTTAPSSHRCKALWLDISRVLYKSLPPYSDQIVLDLLGLWSSIRTNLGKVYKGIYIIRHPLTLWPGCPQREWKQQVWLVWNLRSLLQEILVRDLRQNERCFLTSIILELYKSKPESPWTDSHEGGVPSGLVAYQGTSSSRCRDAQVVRASSSRPSSPYAMAREFQVEHMDIRSYSKNIKAKISAGGRKPNAEGRQIQMHPRI